MIAYWLSFDPDSCMLKYGMGHHMEETTLLTCTLPTGLGSLTETCPKLVTLHGYERPVQLRSVYEAKLSTAGCRSQVDTLFPRHESPPALMPAWLTAAFTGADVPEYQQCRPAWW